jgi:hypothetical protein
VKGHFGADGELGVLLRHEPRLRGGMAALRILLSGRTPALGGWVRFFDPHPMRLWRPGRKRSVATAALLHFAVFFFLIRIPWAMLNQQGRLQLPVIHANYQLIYPLPPRKVQIHSRPKSSTKGHKVAAKPAPTHGAQRAAGAGVKKPTPAPKFTLVLKPPRADNHDQTIIQAGTPPDLRIHHYVPLPNVLLSGLATPKIPKMPTNGAAPKAVKNPVAGAAAMNVPVPVIPDMALAVQVPNKKPPLLASPEVALPLPAPEQALGSIYAVARNGTEAQNSRGLLVLGANPTPPTKLMSIPPGNRYGKFSVALLGGKSGLPSGPGGPAMGAGGNAKTGAAKAAGKGAGNGGFTISGDVGSGAANGAASVAAFGPTSNGSGNDQGVLPPWMAKDLVYPVAKAAHLPAINLIVTAGPIGGGGLGAFGVLSCSTIYTIYLSMPGRPWVLQYCQRKKKDAPPKAAQTNSGVVHFGGGISPPWPLRKFDFHRPPLSQFKRGRMIVLQGTISKDGSVKGLKVYQGVGSVADEAALVAFGKWKFHPATTAKGKPTAVEMLVGIPASVH